MFDRRKFKVTAKGSLSGNMKEPVKVSLVYIIVLLILSTPVMFNSRFNPHSESTTAAFTPVCNAILAIISFAISRYFILFSKNREADFQDFLAGFNSWLTALLATIYYSFRVFLWCLLFIIPGIIKSIAYSQMFFVLAENPKIGVCKALRISRIMTDGFKSDLFAMGLSFIGWELLSAITFHIADMYIIPYRTLSFYNAYIYMKENAIATHRLSAEDFI